MAVTDYSTTPGANVSISGIGINEGCAPGNLNNAIRQLMADIAAGRAAGLFNPQEYQPLDGALSSLSSITLAPDKLPYATGPETFATTDITAVARTIIAATTLEGMRTALGVSAAPVVSGDGTSGSIAFGTFKLAWRSATANANSSTSLTHGGGTSYTSWAKSWWSGGATSTDAQDNNPFVLSTGLTTATVFSALDAANAGTLFSIGV